MKITWKLIKTESKTETETVGFEISKPKPKKRKNQNRNIPNAKRYQLHCWENFKTGFLKHQKTLLQSIIVQLL